MEDLGALIAELSQEADLVVLEATKTTPCPRSGFYKIHRKSRRLKVPSRSSSSALLTGPKTLPP